MKSHLKKIGSICVALILLACASYGSAWARGGGGGGGGGHGGGGGGGGGGMRGGGGHFGGGFGGGGHWGGGHPGGGQWGGHSGGQWGGHYHRGFGFFPGVGLGLGLGYGLGWPYYGWGWGGPYYGWGASYYGWGAPYYPATPSAPPVYVQRQDMEPSAPQPNYWYYCRNPEGYYPYVKECAEGWLQVAPQPSGQQ